jgi:hypothetical protein
MANSLSVAGARSKYRPIGLAGSARAPATPISGNEPIDHDFCPPRGKSLEHEMRLWKHRSRTEKVISADCAILKIKLAHRHDP